MSADLFPFFPPELEREIFELAAELHPESIHSLLLVSRRVCEWIEKIKYRTITTNGIHSTCSFPVVQLAIRSYSKPVSFFQDHVRNFFFRADDRSYKKQHEIGRTLSACNGIQDLVLENIAWTQSILPSLWAMQPRRLSIVWNFEFIELDPHQQMFAFLTHLHVNEAAIAASVSFHLILPDSPLPLFLAELPVLTHFAMAIGLLILGPPEVEQNILASCQNLQVLIVGGAEPEVDEPEELPSIDDVRFLYMDAKFESESDWVNGKRGRKDWWARADAFVAKKRRGEIHPSLSDPRTSFGIRLINAQARVVGLKPGMGFEVLIPYLLGVGGWAGLAGFIPAFLVGRTRFGACSSLDQF
ncbi:hypothetical protein MVEN_00823500 [Mycena venus]|uniref:Uncharacterized protein n=1 Tax=Mycena venus TaxID=2733690 RepID=A0A8H7D184_9AGAR|nr:hypothetical protein MVEN_00823500 [Mycena venus]